MKIAIASDHAGFKLKCDITEHLASRGFVVCDYGTKSDAAVDYPDIALLAAEAVASGDCRFGILICGTGIGVSMCANKVKGIRCALCYDEFSAMATRQHNDANCLALGARVIGTDTARRLIDIFLDTEFSGEARHIGRIDKLLKIEDKYFK